MNVTTTTTTAATTVNDDYSNDYGNDKKVSLKRKIDPEHHVGFA